MTDKTTYPSANDIIVSIKVRLGELDLEIHDAKESSKKAHKVDNFSLASYWGVYYEKALKEKETLEKIMRGEYGRGNN
jgi:hypothetical protein